MTTKPHQEQVTELLHKLAGSDLFARHKHIGTLRALGIDALPALLDSHELPCAATAVREVLASLQPGERERACTALVRALRGSQPLALRLLALRSIAESLADRTAYVDTVVDIAVNRKEDTELRVTALSTLRTSSTLEAAHIEELLALVEIEELGPEAPAALRSGLFSCLKAHAGRLAPGAVMTRLDPFLTSPAPEVRVCALDLLGDVGDVDAIERMCMLPNTADEIRRIKESIGRILLRPTNILALRDEHFEHFVGHLLRKMGHQDVRVTQFSHDGGIDVISYRSRENAKGPALERWAVQCKRWSTNRVDEQALIDLIEASRVNDAKHALMITTSDYTKSAREYAEENSAFVEIVSGVELLAILAWTPCKSG